MELKRTGPNTTVIRTNDGTEILFSYSEPVAAFVPAQYGAVPLYFKTEKFFSRTTAGHVAAWLKAHGAKADIVPHGKLLSIAKEAR